MNKKKITDNIGDAILSAKEKIMEAEALLSVDNKMIQKNIHWYASPKLSVMDKRGMIVPHLDFSENMQLIARLDGKHWVTFMESMANQMSGKEFKERIAAYAHKNGHTMVEVKEMFSADGTATESSVKIIE